MKTVAIIGAGPAGLSAAYALLNESDDYQVTIFEKESQIGGLSKTFEFEGGRLDIGGHRFFSKDQDVLRLWEAVLPFNSQGMLRRHRKSHILWNGKLIEYPIQLDFQTMHTLGFFNAIAVILSYIISNRKQRPTTTLEEFYIHRFGRKLYSMFFEHYTHKLWGIPADQLSSDWGEQRAQKVSLYTLAKSIFSNKKNSKTQERSLITEYLYPAFGSGQLWDSLSKMIMKHGGSIELNSEIISMSLADSQITEITYKKDSMLYSKNFDYVISSMPLRELIFSISSSPTRIRQIGRNLLYRDMIILGVELPIENMGTAFQTAKEDSWLYIQDSKMTFGRVQILNNWSPCAVTQKDSVLLELEFFCNKDDELWNMDDNALLLRSLSELEKCKLCNQRATVRSYIVKRIEKTYPIYTGGYYQLNIIEEWLNNIVNLRCIGRNGQHRYNNMDHSVKTGIEAAKSIMEAGYNQRELWDVNRKQEYLEES